jgi:lipid II:glycine glycyltransferase (peptidoglycan interpeptide bridge formation enzyme)
MVPLAPDDAMLAAFGTSTRRNLRLIEKAPVRIAPIDSPLYAERIDYLAAAAVQRSGGLHVPRDWSTLIEVTARHPSLARLVGVFREDRQGPDSLVAFAWGWMHGQRAEYRDGGSMREPDLKAPLAHGLVWDLMRWARAQGASSFDMGGVTPGRHADGSDALGGISEFKRGFGSTVVNVHEEWVLDATTLRAALARLTRKFLHRRVSPVTGNPFAGAGPSPTSS